MAIEEGLVAVEGDPFHQAAPTPIVEDGDILIPVEGDPFEAKPQVPAAFIERVKQGSALSRIAQALGDGVTEGFGHDTIGIGPDAEAKLREIGLFVDPDRPFRMFPIRMANEALLKPAAWIADAAVRAISAGATGIAAVIGQTAEETGATIEGGGGRVARDAKALFDIGGLLSMAVPSASFTRFGRGRMGETVEREVGGLPKDEDFLSAARAATNDQPNPSVQAKIERAWHEQGIHPAEIADDMKTDPVLAAQVLSRNDDAIEYYSQPAKAAPVTETVAGFQQTRGQGRKFHGSPVEVSELDPDFYGSSVAYYGHGVYTTDAMDVAVGYSKRGRSKTPHVYEIEETRPVNIYDMEAPIDARVRKQLDELAESPYGDTPEVVVDALDTNPKSLREFYDAVRDAAGGFVSADEVQEGVFQPIADTLRSMGFDGMRHKGGLRTKTPEHDVTIYINPEAIKLKKVDPEDFRPAEPGSPTDITVRREGGIAGGGGGGAKPPARIGALPEGEPPAPGSLGEAQKKVLDRVSVGEAGKGRGWTWGQLYTNAVDHLFPLSRESKAARKEGIDLATEDDPYRMARLYAGWQGKADTMIRRETFDFNTYAPNGPSLEAILAPVKADLDGFRAFVVSARAAELEARGVKTGLDMDAVQAVGKARTKKNVETFEKLVNYQNKISAYLRDAGVLSQAGYDAMVEANRLFVPFHRVLGDAAGIELHAPGKSLTARNPIRRIEGSEKVLVDPIESIIKNTYLLTAMAEKNVVGTKLVDLMLRGSKEAKTMGLRSDEVLQIAGPASDGKVLEYLTAHGMKKPPKDLADAIDAWRAGDADTITIFRNGKRETYRVDPDIAKVMKGLDGETMHWIFQVMGAPASTLRAGAVLSPDFSLRHLLREMQYAMVTTEKGLYTPVNLVRGVWGQIVEDADFWDWKKGGGGHVTIVSLDRSYSQETLNKQLGDVGVFSRSWNVIRDPNVKLGEKVKSVAGLPVEAWRKMLTPLQAFTDLALSSYHLGAFKKAKRRIEKERAESREVVPVGQEIVSDTGGKRDIIEAAWVARETTIDMQRIGGNTRALNMISAFANARIQDVDKLFRTFKDHPVKATLMGVLGTSLPSVLLWSVNNEDSRYKELAQWEKDVFWHIITDKWEPASPEEQEAVLSEEGGPRGADQYLLMEDGTVYVNNGTIYRYPKNFTLGIIFGSGAERVLEAWKAGGGGKQVTEWAKSIVGTAVGEVTPTALAPAFDQAMNRRAFSGSTVIPHNLEGQLPEYQYLDYTTETAKALGRVISSFPGIREASTDTKSAVLGGAARTITSPILIESYIRGWTGTLGTYILKTLDLGLRKAGIVADPQKPASTLADIPFIKAFVSRYPSAGAQSITEFYEKYDVSKRYYDTWTAKAREGDVDAMQRIQAMGGDQMLVQLDVIQTALSEQASAIRSINKLTAEGQIEPYEARQLIDTLYFYMIQVGQLGREMQDQIEQAAQGDSPEQ